MKKISKKDLINLLIISSIVFIYILIVTRFFKYIYGSMVDWDCQHWSIPNYFRNLFYQTGNLFPNFAFNLGNGQNIYYLAYYGLLNPIIIISYLFPYIKMVNYIQIASILGVIISAISLYVWILRKHNTRIAFLSTFFFITSTPLLFHSHRHIMFINYMPFLILALVGVDKYFENNKKTLLIISIFLIIMCSYYFSVSAIAVIILYGIYVFYQKNKSSFFKEGLKFLLPILLGVLMSCVLILPTFYVILKGRVPSVNNISFTKLLIPNLNIQDIFYSTYSLGLNILLLFTLVINIIKGNKVHRIVSLLIVILLFIPICSFLLNGTLYVDNKVFITLLPLVSLLVANAIKLFCESNSVKSIIFTLIISIIILIFSNSSIFNIIFIIDLISTLLLLYIGIKIEQKQKIIVFVMIISGIISMVCTAAKDELYKKSEYTSIQNSWSHEKLDFILDNDINLYRVTNQNDLLKNINTINNIKYYVSNIYSSTSNDVYEDYYYNHSGSEINQRSYGKISGNMNIFYNLYNANKYLIASDYVPVGYKLISGNIYQNSDVLPIIYATSNIMGKNVYDKLEFPYNMEALLGNVIVDKNIVDQYDSNIREININFSVLDQRNIDIYKQKNTYIIDAKEGNQLILSTEELNKDDVLILSFNVENNNNCPNDLAITINGVKNVLTCNDWKYHNNNLEFHYVISQNEKISNLSIEFYEGLYNISNIKMYSINYNDLRKVRNSIDEFYFDKKNTNGDYIEGQIEITNDGYLYLSIPYDDGFNIYLNNKKYDYEKVDNSFIGVRVKKGTYNVKIEYNAPLFKEGILLSSIGFLTYIIIVIKEVRKNKKILDLN